LVLNGDFDGIQNWSTGNFPDPPDSEGYAMHLNGEVHLRIQKNNSDAPYNLQFFQPVSVAANQTYLLSIKARSDQPRRIRLVVAQNGGTYTTYGELVNRYSETDPIALTPTMSTYETVFTAPVADQQARLSVQFGDSPAEVVIDDVSLTPTTLPVTVAGDLAGTPPPTGSDPGTTPPPGGGTTPPAGNGSTPGAGSTPGGGTLGTAPNQSDATGGGAVGGLPVGAGASVNGAMPPVPNGSPAKGTCTVDSDCGGPYKCSMQLGLCYETTYGYVWSANQNAWTQPPSDVLGCGPDYVYWPLQRGCYDPKSGYAFDPNTLKWVYVGDNYTAGRDPVTNDGGCSVSTGSERGGAGWLLAGLAGAATVIGGRRRRSRG